LIFIIDASIIVKWFVDEERRDKARDLLREGIFRFVPDIVFSEVANARRKKIVMGEISAEQARSVLHDLPVYLPNVVATELIIYDAFELAVEMEHPVTDCLYLACAQHLGGQVISDDVKSVRKCRERYSSSVVLLNEWKTI